MVEEKKTLKRITGGELSKIFEKLKEDGLVFRCNFSQLSKHFLSNFLPLDIFSVDFETLKAAYLEHIEFTEEKEIESEGELNKLIRKKRNEEIFTATINETNFHKYICKTYFSLIKEPKEELLQTFVKASQDIKAIDEILRDIQKQMDEIHNRNQTDEIQEKKPILHYYKHHNERAKEEILNFIKDGINEYALNSCYDDSILTHWFLKNSYSYSWNAKSFKVTYPNDLENKFGILPYPDFIELSNQYKNDKPTFYKYLTQFISEEEIVFSTNELIQHHHVLDVRKEIIAEALNTYQHGAKSIFTNAVPTIIEGVLHDLCLLIGEKENDLLQEGFQYKLDKLQPVLGWQLYYEYYSFRFRLIRNKVAHGRLTKADVDELADLLLLDLHQVCKLVQSDKIELNHKRFVIDELNKNIANPDFKYLMEYLLLDKINVPAFYKLEGQIAEVEKLIVGNEFWEFLEEEMDKSVEAVKHGIYMILKIISKRKPFDSRCTKLLKQLGITELDKDLAKEYLKYLTRDF